MDLIFCTLFDSNYLDKGLVLYHSMQKCMNDFKLYVFAFDERCEDILRAENLDHMIVVGMKEFESKELLEVKSQRTRAEYCWTCSPWVIKYVIEHFGEGICTYIDADMMFFSSPQCVFDDMRSQHCSSIIVPHRFENEQEEKKAYDTVGAYCVEFNTFVNDKNGMEALNWWADQCLKWCYYAVPGTTEWYGDQKYLNVFPQKFQGVYICNHWGVGAAPWNVALLEKTDKSGEVPYVFVKQTKEEVPIIIYHYENVSFLSKHILHVSSRIKSKELRDELYKPYVQRIIDERKYIEDKYKFSIPKVRRVVTKNPLMVIYQKYISPIRRVKHLADLYWIK